MQVAERHALEAKRQSEAKERILRQKEREEAQAKAAALEKLQHDRHEQILTKTQYLSAQAAHDREEFERVLQAQKELIAAEEAKHKEDAVRLVTFSCTIYPSLLTIFDFVLLTGAPG